MSILNVSVSYWSIEVVFFSLVLPLKIKTIVFIFLYYYCFKIQWRPVKVKDKTRRKKKTKKTGMQLQCCSWRFLLILQSLKSQWLLIKKLQDSFIIHKTVSLLILLTIVEQPKVLKVNDLKEFSSTLSLNHQTFWGTDGYFIIMGYFWRLFQHLRVTSLFLKNNLAHFSWQMQWEQKMDSMKALSQSVLWN